nr:MAG TPA: hypothetical protein [Caudoviricetes sp.]
MGKVLRYLFVCFSYCLFCKVLIIYLVKAFCV